MQLFAFPSPLSNIGHTPQIPLTAASQSLSVRTSKPKYPSYKFSVKYRNSLSVRRGADGCSNASMIYNSICSITRGFSPFLMCSLISNKISKETINLLLMLKTPEQWKIKCLHLSICKQTVLGKYLASSL